MSESIQTHTTLIPGLFYIDNVIDDPLTIITELDEYEWKPIRDSAKSRLVQHYGYNYKTSKVSEEGEKFPKCIRSLAGNLTKICKN